MHGEMVSALYTQAHRQGGGGLLEPLFWPPNNFIHHLAIHCPKWSTNLTANENHRFPNEFAAMQRICSWRTSG